MTGSPQLRLNQGDASESRAYYCAHFVAAERGYFADEGVAVTFTTAQGGAGTTILGAQIPAVIEETADLAIGGPMLLMRMAQEGDARLVAFCAAVAANPWVLVAAAPQPGFTLAHLRGRVVRDIARIGTATLTFGWLLRQHGLGPDDVLLEPGSGDESADIAVVASGACAYGLHSLHALGGAVAEGRLTVVADLAALTGPIPWSAYIAGRERLAALPDAFAAFTRAISRALAWIGEADAAAVTEVVRAHYPALSPDGLLLAIAGYKASGTFAAGPAVARADHDRFAAILTEAGWLDAPVPYEAVFVTLPTPTTRPQ
jgi:NitT/TauT family transport system substrate-binding protein